MNAIRIVGYCLIPVSILALSVNVRAQELNKYPKAVSDAAGILAKYPSRVEVLRQLEELQKRQPGIVDRIHSDFDQAIRSVNSIEPPELPNEGRTHAVAIRLRQIYTRTNLMRLIEQLEAQSDASKLVGYYREHFDDFTIEDTPELSLVMMEILAVGWNDWSNWDEKDDALAVVRRKFPDLHRIYATTYLQESAYVPATGLLLSVLTEENTSGELWGAAVHALEEFPNYEGILSFYIDTVLLPPPLGHWRELWTSIPSLCERIGCDERAQKFWAPYLDSDVPTLKYCALIAHNRPVPGGPNGFLEEHQKWQMINDPDPKVRREIKYHRLRREVKERTNPETGRLSPEDLAEIQRIDAEEKAEAKAEETTSNTASPSADASNGNN